MNINELNQRIDEIDRIGNEAWMSNLEDRKLKELEFHNKDRDKDNVKESIAEDTYEKFYGNKKYYSVTNRSYGYVEDWIKLRCKNGGVFLDYACGNGNNARTAAKAGADLALGLDISDVSIKNCRETAKEEGITNIRYFQADAENTKLPDNSVDTLLCSGMLHHLDLSYSFPEIRRILKPGGKLLAVEALDYNPLIKLYRVFTPAMRTEWEKAHILSLKDVDFGKRFFELGDVNYWHVVGYAAGKFPFLRAPLETLDKALEKIPYVQRMAWIFTFEFVKPHTK